MDNLRTKVNKLNGGYKFMLRILYPIVLYTIFFLMLVRQDILAPRLAQLIFILLWGGIEWYFFLSVKKNDS